MPHRSSWPTWRTSSTRPSPSTGSTDTDGSSNSSCPTTDRNLAMCAAMLTYATLGELIANKSRGRPAYRWPPTADCYRLGSGRDVVPETAVVDGHDLRNRHRGAVTGRLEHHLRARGLEFRPVRRAGRVRVAGRGEVGDRGHLFVLQRLLVGVKRRCDRVQVPGTDVRCSLRRAGCACRVW